MSDRGAISYFYDIVATDRREKELREFRGKVVGTYCNFLPDEIVYALGALPVRLCSGDDSAVRAAEDIFPRDTCSLVKSCIGAAASGSGIFSRLDLVVIPTPCDAKKKLGGVVGEFKQVHMLELPASKSSPSALNYWFDQVGALITRLESLTGKKLTREALAESIALLNRRREAFGRFLGLRGLVPAAVTGEEALVVTQASFTDDVSRWTEQVHRLCEEREAKPVSGPHKARFLLTGAPLIYPNIKLIQAIESTGAVVAIDETCSGTQRLYNPVVVRDRSLRSMVRAVAEKSLLPPTCPCFIEQTDRTNRILELKEEFGVDGVIYHSLRVCPLFDIESIHIQRELKSRSIPCLLISTDYSREDTQQVRTRVEAFVEMVSEMLETKK